MSDTPLPEPLESFLREPPTAPPAAKLQQTILRQTLAQLPRPVWRRRWSAFGGIAASIVLVILAAYWGLSRRVEPAPKQDVVQRKSDSTVEEKKPTAATEPANPLELEWSAFDAEETPRRVRLYFQAGDLYIERFQDYDSALRCYRQALAFCDAGELALNPNDNWLVMALKSDRRKDY